LEFRLPAGQDGVEHRQIRDEVQSGQRKTWQPIGFWLSLVRQLVHWVDQMACYIGFLWPLWDHKRQTFADMITSTVCVPLNSPPPQIPPALPYQPAGYPWPG
jgi:RDD family